MLFLPFSLGEGLEVGSAGFPTGLGFADLAPAGEGKEFARLRFRLHRGVGRHDQRRVAARFAGWRLRPFIVRMMS